MKQTLKRRAIILALGAGLLAAGCARSVNPFFTAKDVVFEPALIGVWSAVDSPEQSSNSWTFEKVNDDAYKLIQIESERTNEYCAHLFVLSGKKYLDCLTADDVGLGVPFHFLFKVSQTEPTLKLAIFDYDWLAKYIQEHPDAIRHAEIPDDAYSTNKVQYVITADTPELQKFIVKHQADEGAFPEGKEMKRRK